MNHDDFDPYAQWLGIRADEHPVDHYRLLGLARFESDPAKIQAAADQRMRHVRSFQTGPRGLHTQKLLNEIAAAKLRLLDVRSKAAYDESLRASPQTDADDFGLSEDTDSAWLPPVLDAASTPALDPAPRSPSPAVPAMPQSPLIQPAGQGSIDVASPRRGKRTRSRSAGPGIGTYALVFLFGVGATAGIVWSVGRGMRTAQQDTQQAETSKPPSSPAATARKVAVQHASGIIYLTPQNCTIHGDSPQVVEDDGQLLITDWTETNDWLSWEFQVRRGGIFRVKLTYALHPDAAGTQVEFVVDDSHRKQLDLRDSDGPDNFITDQVLLGAKEPGLHTLQLRALNRPGDQVMIFQSLEIEPFRGRSEAE